MTRKRVLLVDDHELFRSGIALIINNQPDMEVVGQAGDGLEAYTLACELCPDLIVMDINMPISDGLEATHLIHAHLPEIQIIMLTASEEEEKLFSAIKAGAQGYILKSSSSTELIRGIRGALEGEASVPRKLVSRLLAEFSNMAKRSNQKTGEDIPPLMTHREREVLNIMASGASNQEIAEQLSIGIQTVKSHVSSVLSKLHAKSRQEASELGIKQGLIHRKS